jgi:O-antigen ligase
MPNAGSHFFFSLFLLLCLICGAGVYQFFADHMEWMLKRRVADLSILLWVALGIFTKFYDAATLHEPVLYQRGGGIYGSNHVGGILILLLPFASSGVVMVIGYLFLLFNFSRGIWLAMGILVLLWGFTVNAKHAIKAAAAVALVLAFISLMVGADFRQVAADFARERYEGMSLDVMGQNERWEIYDSAMEMAKKTSFVGVGLGGFVWGLSDELGQQPNFSNAHNLYLTSLAEGGILFALTLIAFLCFLTGWSFYIYRPAFCALATWTFYGFFSGEIYESANLATAGDYYCLLFVAAFLMYKTRQREQAAGDFLFANI